MARSDREIKLRSSMKTLIDSVDGTYRRMGSLLNSDWELMCEVQRFVRAEFERREKADKLSYHTTAAAKLSSRLSFLMHEWSRSRMYVDMQTRDLNDIHDQLRAEILRQKTESQEDPTLDTSPGDRAR